MSHHPAFQSLFLPLLLALLGMLLVRAALGARHAGWGALLGLLAALAWWPGMDWPATARVQKLPWLVLVSLGLLVAQGVRGGPGAGRQPALWLVLVALLVWATAAGWLAGGQTGALALGAAIGFGGLVLLGLGWGHDGPSDLGGTGANGHPVAPTSNRLTVAVLIFASLGLAALAGTGGSLLLAQLVLMLASSLAVLGAWAWFRPDSGVRVAPALRLAFGLVWLGLAWSWLLSAPGAGQGTMSPIDSAAAARAGGLALALVVPALLAGRAGVSRQSQPGSIWRKALVLALAAMPVLLALGWPGAAGLAPMADTASDPTDLDDPYLTPSWR